jgi:hypothetical protein
MKTTNSSWIAPSFASSPPKRSTLTRPESSPIHAYPFSSNDEQRIALLAKKVSSAM